MEDLKNKRLYKIMWLPRQDQIIFDTKREKPVGLNSHLYKVLSNHVDWLSWIRLYKKKYNSWLNNDDSSIYDINDEVNFKFIESLSNMNNHLLKEKIFYWFDVDRTFNEDFEWEICPISKKRLIRLPEGYPKINSLISPEYPLIFPTSSRLPH